MMCEWKAALTSRPNTSFSAGRVGGSQNGDDEIVSGFRWKRWKMQVGYTFACTHYVRSALPYNIMHFLFSFLLHKPELCD